MLKGKIVHQVHPPPTSGDLGVYVLDTGCDGLYIGDWRIECDHLYHRHPYEWDYGLTGQRGVLEYDVTDRECWKCEATCSDSIWLAHKLQQI